VQESWREIERRDAALRDHAAAAAADAACINALKAALQVCLPQPQELSHITASLDFL
jgi:hypothetical protein